MPKSRRAETPAEPLNAPAFVYFWGPVRSHVNRVALEYARRLHRSPVWLSVPDGPAEATPIGGPSAGEPIRVFALNPEDDIAATTEPIPAPVPEQERSPTVDLATDVGHYLQFPDAARSALEALAKTTAPSVLVLSNLDRLGHANLLTDPRRSAALLGVMKARGVAVIVTSQGLIHAPAVPMECAFRVDSAPDEDWRDAELWPGVPVSSCTECSGSVDGAYASCSPMLRQVCPLRLPFTSPAEAAPA